ncbi:MAG TPA: hypothetical protein VFK02_16040 [Kofleriaceae bacterium]|nr:hypothetical protein [Kofleriaceae bacterium]
MTKNRRPDATAGAATEPSLASKTPPEPSAPRATSEPDLESRIKVRRVELVAKLRELRADTRAGASEAGDKLKAKLSEIAHIIKDGVVDGWASLSDSARQKLERWLTESAQQIQAQKLAAKSAPAQDRPAKPGQ